MRQTRQSTPILVTNQFPTRVAPASFKGQLTLESDTGDYFKSRSAGPDAIWDQVFVGSAAELASNPQLMSEIGASTGTMSPKGLVFDSVSSATLNTTLIQDMLNSAFYRAVVLPEGLIYVNALSVPANKELTGSFSRAYTTRPTTGTRLQCASAAQTTAVVTMNGRCKLTNIAVLGSTGTPQHNVVRIANNGAILRDCALGYGVDGVAAEYKLAILDNVHIYNNTNRGIADILDGKVISCTINANGSHGIYAGTGANATQYIGNRIEWNGGRGISLYQTQSVTLLGNIIDRNGKVGIHAVSNDYLQIVSNNIWRNGAQSSGTAVEDCNIYLQSNTHFSITGNVTKKGENDGGGGYNSPIVAVRAQSNSDGVVTTNDFTGTNGLGWSQISADTNVIRHSNKLPSTESETYIGSTYVATGQATGIAAAATGSIVLALPPLPVNGSGRIYRLQITARDHGSSTPSGAAVVDIWISRNLSANAVVGGTLTNIVNSLFGLGSGTYNVTMSVSADGSSLTVDIVNGAAATRTFLVRVT